MKILITISIMILRNCIEEKKTNNNVKSTLLNNWVSVFVFIMIFIGMFLFENLPRLEVYKKKIKK